MDDAQDIILARSLLFGFIVKDNKELPRRHFLSDETEARAALSRLIFDGAPLEPLLRCGLASLINPDTTNERRIDFVNHRKGRQRQAEAGSAIASAVTKELLRSHVLERRSQYLAKPTPLKIPSAALEEAAGNVADCYGIDESNVKKHWRRHRPFTGQIYRCRQGDK